MIYRRSMTEHVSGDDARLPHAPSGGTGGVVPPRQQRHLVTEIPGPVSRELLTRRERAVARGVSHVLPVFVTAAGGGVLVDADGNQLIDFGSGIAVTSVGNAAPEVVDRVREQVEAFTHTCFMVTPYAGRDAVVVFDHAYHGRTNLTMAMTAKNLPYKDGFGPFAGEVYRAPMSYPFRDAVGLDGKLAAERAITLIESQVGADQ